MVSHHLKWEKNTWENFDKMKDQTLSSHATLSMRWFIDVEATYCGEAVFWCVPMVLGKGNLIQSIINPLKKKFSDGWDWAMP